MDDRQKYIAMERKTKGSKTLKLSSPITFVISSIVLCFTGLFVMMKGSTNQTVTEKSGYA